MTTLTIDDMIARFQERITALDAENAALRGQIAAMEREAKAKDDRFAIVDAQRACYENTLKIIQPDLGYPARARVDRVIGVNP